MTQLPAWLDMLTAALVVVGVAFALVGSLGLAKLSDFLKRLHGPTKASTLGVGCILIASMLYFAARGEATLHELLITLFVFLTAPVSAHLLVKAAMRLDPRLAPPDPPTVTGTTPGEADRDAPR
jgi:multicomponent K+:H+ antiporter subunit G